MKKPHFDVLVIGSPCVDLIFSGMPHWPILGQEMYVPDFAISAGAVFNTAATLARLGLRVGMLSELGNDFFSNFILEEMEKAGICRDLVNTREYPLRSVSVCLAYRGERGFVSYADTHSGALKSFFETLTPAGNPGGKDHADSLLQSLRASLDDYTFDAAFLYAHPRMLPVLDILARRANLPIFLDVGWHPEYLSWKQLLPVIRYASYLMPNQLEALAITGMQTPEEAVRYLTGALPTAIVKVGARGVIACQQGQAELITCPALPIETVVDTTGAGDAFNGGFIYGVLKGYSLVEALRCGVICGSLSTTALTGKAAVPTADELERLRASVQQ